MLDALEQHAEDRLDGVDLGDIEWFHRLRNQLYHQGNGLTIEREKVETYAELAKILFCSLFDMQLEITPPVGRSQQRLGAFLEAWVEFERVIGQLARHLHGGDDDGPLPRPPIALLRELVRSQILEQGDQRNIEKIRVLRNEVVHGAVQHDVAISDAIVDELRALTTKYEGVAEQMRATLDESGE